jgi:hypothetical protein
MIEGRARMRSHRDVRKSSARLCVPTKNVLGESPSGRSKMGAVLISAPEEEVNLNLKDPAYRRCRKRDTGCVVSS